MRSKVDEKKARPLQPIAAGSQTSFNVSAVDSDAAFDRVESAVMRIVFCPCCKRPLASGPSTATCTAVGALQRSARVSGYSKTKPIRGRDGLHLGIEARRCRRRRSARP
jgi:hypothetical protein